MFSESKNLASGLQEAAMSAVDFAFAEVSVLCVEIFASASVMESGLLATTKEIASAAAKGSLTLSGDEQKFAARYVGFTSRLSREVESKRCDYIASLQTTISEPNQSSEATAINCPPSNQSQGLAVPHL